jgi:Flp pilus assembly protein TadD
VPAKTPDADENAFPEAQSEAAEKQATENESADRKAASSGSAVAPGSPESETGSSSRDKLKGLDLLGDNESRIANGAGGTIVDPKLSAQDLKVGQQYMGMGDYAGAYGRFKEACTVNPGNVEAVFYLAEAARKTAHLDESAENYRIYLQVQPDGPKAKAARKALAQLEGK